MANIRIKDLTRDASPKQDDIIPIDLAGTRGATVKSVVESGRPTASRSEAESGTDAHKAMTPLTTKQAIDAQVGAAYVAKTVSVNAGSGLSGGGNLSGNVTVSLNQTNINRLNKVDGIQAGAQVNTVNSVAGKTGNVTLNKNDVGLNNVDNTSDINKPISNDMQEALNNKVSGIVAGDFIEVDSTSVTNPVVSLSEHAQQIITDNSLARHTHSNKAILDKINEPFTKSLKEKIDTSIKAPGGITGQVLTKASDADGNVIWSSIEAATAVSYAPQTLTAEQQTQARSNIDAIAKSGDYLEGLLTTRFDADARILLPGQGSYVNVEINYSSAGNVGFYNQGTGEWAFRVNQGNGHLYWKGGILSGSDGNINGTAWSDKFGGSGWAAEAIKSYIDNKASDASLLTKGTIPLQRIPHLVGAQGDGYIRLTNAADGREGFNSELRLWTNGGGEIVHDGTRIVSWDTNQYFSIARAPTSGNHAATKAYVDSRPAWPGVYTGTDRNTLSYPVGSVVLAGRGPENPDRNSAVTVKRSSDTTSFIIIGTGTNLAGSWRARGAGGTTAILCQRVS